MERDDDEIIIVEKESVDFTKNNKLKERIYCLDDNETDSKVHICEKCLNKFPSSNIILFWDGRWLCSNCYLEEEEFIGMRPPSTPKINNIDDEKDSMVIDLGLNDEFSEE